MRTPQDSLVFEYNGEIYNYSCLGEKYNIPKYYRSSDTLVVSFLLGKYGIKIVRELRGMFAIAVYDPNEELVYLVRDQLGIKPLYYYAEDYLMFSSDFRGIEKEVKLMV